MIEFACVAFRPIWEWCFHPFILAADPAAHHRHQFERFGVEVIEAHRCSGPLKLDLKTPVYISMDLDALDRAHAPSVTFREPGGLTTRQVIDWIHAIDQPIVAADIVEFNPRCDISNMTANAAAKLLKEIAGMMVKTAQSD